MNIHIQVYIDKCTEIIDLQVIRAFEELVSSLHGEAPMRILRFSALEKFGKLPRSSDNLTSQICYDDKDLKLVFISHRWLRPWHTKEECEEHGHVWAGMAHPDDAAGSKYKLICAGVRKLVEKKGWDISQVALWLDFCCIEQDDKIVQAAGIKSLRGYISICDAVLIPSPEVPAASARTVDQITGDYGGRAWTRLESMSFYTVSIVCIHTPCLNVCLIYFLHMNEYLLITMLRIYIQMYLKKPCLVL